MLDGDAKLLEVAKCYGFKNIQNTVQKLKRSKLKLDYVEIMACPSGCINGSGQFRGQFGAERRSVLESVQLPALNDTDEKMEEEMKVVQAQWASLNPAWMELLYTKYRVLEKNSVNKEPAPW